MEHKHRFKIVGRVVFVSPTGRHPWLEFRCDCDQQCTIDVSIWYRDMTRRV